MNSSSDPLDVKCDSVSLSDILITGELDTRSTRMPDHAKECQSLVALARAMVDSPATVFQRLVETTLELCQAGSAGISILEDDQDPCIFRWRATTGRLAPFLNGTMPRDFSPCGVVLDTDDVQLMRHPIRFFPYIDQLQMPIVEVLLVPLHIQDRVIGTIWVVSHVEERRFDAEDARLMTSLSQFASAAVQTLQIAQQAHDAADASKHSEDRYRTLFNSIDEGFCVIEMIFDDAGKAIDYRFLEINPAFEKQTGLVDSLGKTMREILPNHEESWFEIYGKVALTGESVRFVNEARELDHNWFDLYAFRLGEEGSKKVAVLFTNITKRKRAEALLSATDRLKDQRISNQKKLLDAVSAMRVNQDLTIETVLKVLAENIRELVGAHQSVSSMTVANDWTQTINAISVSDKYEAAFADYTTMPDGSGIYRLVTTQRQTFRLTQAELESHPAWRNFGAESGKHPPMRGWLAAPLIGVDGAPIGLIQLSDKMEGEFSVEDEAVLVQFCQISAGLLENIRLYKESEREIQLRQKAEGALREADIRKDEFLATLAHELRNPLAPVRNSLQILQMKGQDDSEVQWSTEVIERQVKHLTRLIDDLMDVSRITRDKLELQRQRIELSSVLRSAVEMSRPSVEQFRQELIFTQAAEPIFLQGDTVRLAQVVMNLLTNAAKYSPLESKIWLSASREGSHAVIRVRDNGLGIPADKLPHLFEMFFQVDRSMERAQSGLGIGLSLVRRLVELHEGKVEAFSAGVGKGSEFVVTLPMEIVEVAAAPPAKDGDGIKPAARRILVVDDNRDSANTLAMLLKINGHEVQKAYDGLEAIATAANFLPDVVLLDLGMPKMNGYDVCSHLRQLPWGKSITLVALTGWGQEEDIRRTTQAGFNAHLVKPLTMSSLQTLFLSLDQQANPS